MNPPPGAELMDDVVEEILLRLPPDEPACLARASAVCKRWRRLLSDPAFLRRYRAYHRAPPLLGFLHSLDDLDHLSSFVPTTALPISQPALKFPGWVALDCRHGRALLAASFRSRGLIVWHPMTGQLRRLPHLDIPYFLYYAAAVVCSSGGCDHLDCLGGPFLVVAVGASKVDEKLATVYSSDSDAWSPLTSVHHGEHHDFGIVMKPAALVGDALYFALLGAGILKYHLGNHSLSLIDPPVVFEGGIVLTPLAGNVLGLVGLERYILSLWSRDVNLDGGVAKWEKRRVIELDSLLPSLVLTVTDQAVPIAFVEGADIVFVRTYDGVFTIDLKSMCVRKVCQRGRFYAVVPYTSFYTPDVHLQHNRAQFSTEQARWPQDANMGGSSSEQPRQCALLHHRRQAGRPVNDGNVVRFSGRASRLPSQVRPPWRP